MSDSERVSGIVFKFVDGEEITESDARLIASQWHGGQNTALYAFASSGTILPELLDEITCELPADKKECEALFFYVKEHQS